MKYRVINKDGRKAVIEYVCFGALQMVDAWNTELRHAIRLYDSDNNTIDWRLNPEGKEVRNDCTYIAGFYPENFQTLQYLFPDDGPGVDLFVKHHEEILKHPLFDGITVDNDDQYMFASIEMAGRQMDATIYPMLFIRNMCQYNWVTSSFEFALESGASVIEAFFIANLVGRSFGMDRNKPWYSMDGSDSTIMWSTSAPLGDLIEGIKGEMPRTYLDLKWEETDQGYSAYGTLASPYRNWDDMDWDDDDDDEDWDEEPAQDPATSLQKHPIIGLPATLVSSSAFKKSEDYPEELRAQLMTIRPTTDEEFVEFVKKVSKYVKD